ncbi:MAG: DUF6732 family protein [Pseudomonadota bacterium]
MKRLIIALVPLFPGVAQAHPGHLAEVAGHGHWLAAGALAAAAALALWAAKGRKAKEEEIEDISNESPEDEEPQEA